MHDLQVNIVGVSMQWVPGQLLVEKNGNFAFLWEDVNFIIRFQRVDVHDIVSTQLAKLPPFGAI